MREIKFRVWDNILNKWMYPVYDITNPFPTNNGHDIMQYTGLKDKNGVECYDKDIIKYGKYTEIVSWSDNRGAWWPFNSGLAWHIEALYPMDRSKPEFEVIGNIHQNPELL